MSNQSNQPESYWKEKLTPEQYRVCRLKGTERAFSGALYNNHQKGMYECVACGQPLFSSDTKFDSGTGWPSFDSPVNGSISSCIKTARSSWYVQKLCAKTVARTWGTSLRMVHKRLPGSAIVSIRLR